MSIDSLGTIRPYRPFFFGSLLDGIHYLLKADVHKISLYISTGVFMFRIPLEKVAYELILSSTAESRMSWSPYLNGVWDVFYMTVQLLYYRILLPGFVRNSS